MISAGWATIMVGYGSRRVRGRRRDGLPGVLGANRPSPDYIGPDRLTAANGWEQLPRFALAVLMVYRSVHVQENLTYGIAG